MTTNNYPDAVPKELKSYWACKSYLVNEEKFYWLSAHLATNIGEVLRRVACKQLSKNDIEQMSDGYCFARDPLSVCGQIVDIEIQKGIEMPNIGDPDHVTVHNWWGRDLSEFLKNNPPAREGYTSVPLDIKF
jgi:hypothetical protein